jgi:hypothetical protein
MLLLLRTVSHRTSVVMTFGNFVFHPFGILFVPVIIIYFLRVLFVI